LVLNFPEEDLRAKKSHSHFPGGNYKNKIAYPKE
jgi:hypothetical protein